MIVNWAGGSAGVSLGLALLVDWSVGVFGSAPVTPTLHSITLDAYSLTPDSELVGLFASPDSLFNVDPEMTV